MPVNLLKMCVGIDSVVQLRRAQARRLEAMAARGEDPVLRHWTRNTPRRADELTDGGSLYWIIKGAIRVRQRITAIEQAKNTGANKKCALVLAPELVETLPVPARPMQGWRYLEGPSAPADLSTLPAIDGLEEMPEPMVQELRDLGLI
jgi:hypothetical protein